MILEGQDEGVRRGLKGTLSNGFNHLLQRKTEWKGENVTYMQTSEYGTQLKRDEQNDSGRWLHLEGNFGCHGEAVCNNGLLIRWTTFPAVQLDTTAPGEQNLSVHLH